MSNTAINHYLSQFIIRNFAENHEQLYELNLQTGMIKPRSVTNLFSGRRLWNQNFEDKLTKNIENDLAKVIRKVRNMPFAERPELFQAHEIIDKKDCDIISRIVFQPLLFQAKDSKEAIKNLEPFINNSDYIKSHSQIFYVKIRKDLANVTPLVLIDNSVYICPVYINKPNLSAHIAFSYPISPYEFILFLSYQDVLSFLEQHSYSVHEINMRAITQQNKECRIASANKQYLELIKNTINSYTMNTDICKVIAARYPS